MAEKTSRRTRFYIGLAVFAAAAAITLGVIITGGIGSTVVMAGSSYLSFGYGTVIGLGAISAGSAGAAYIMNKSTNNSLKALEKIQNFKQQLEKVIKEINEII